MVRFVLIAFIATWGLVFCFSQDPFRPDKDSLLQRFKEADVFFNQAEIYSFNPDSLSQAKATLLYARALPVFRDLIPAAAALRLDSLLFFLFDRTAFIHYDSGNNDSARLYYLSALRLKQRLPSVPDSFLFKPLLYTGSIYYSEHQFDSAFSFYREAEQISNQYSTSLRETQRLYNRIGVMYYETGNYHQARNYFEKAIAVLALTEPDNVYALANYRINIASMLVKLKDYEKARTIYQTLLSQPFFLNEIHHNLGIIALRLNDFSKAIEMFRMVEYGENRLNTDLYYNYAMAFAGTGQNDSVDFYLSKAMSENYRWNQGRRNISYGLILKFQGDQLVKTERFEDAVMKYHSAIHQFDVSFQSPSIFKNPDHFSGTFSYFNLFNALTAKGDAFAGWYQARKNIELLKASLDAYRSAFNLAEYVEKTYDSDEARLFLNEMKYEAHGRPIDISLDLYELTGEFKYLEEAYSFDQRNKASVLSLNIKENEWKENKLSENSLLQKEASLKSGINRLLLRSSQTSDSLARVKLISEIRDLEIRLGQVQENIHASSDLNKQLDQRIPSSGRIQRLLDKNAAVVSYHLSDQEVVAFIISPQKFSYRRTNTTKGFKQLIDSFKYSLHLVDDGKRYGGFPLANRLYQQLIIPLEKELRNKDRIVIIPDDELHYFPFEALQDSNRNFLLQKFSVQYQYATAMLEMERRKKGSGIVAFAPFASSGFRDEVGHYELSRLPASAVEVNQPEGRIFLDSHATKDNFLKEANHYSILHLATHAEINNNDPLRSFISFYPANDREFRLYAQEIYDLDLDSTDLVILSACETGSGELIKGEGMMSLSRAFAYAGCRNILASLWKAEDKATSLITQSLHRYLREGFTKDKALQQAKLDLLHNPTIDSRLKSPGHWAHLIFIGEYEKEGNDSKWWWIIIIIILCAFASWRLLYNLIQKKRRLLRSQSALRITKNTTL